MVLESAARVTGHKARFKRVETGINEGGWITKAIRENYPEHCARTLFSLRMAKGGLIISSSRTLLYLFERRQ